MEDVIAVQGLEKKFHVAQNIESVPVMKPKVFAVIVDLIGLFRIEIQSVGFPAELSECPGQVPGVVVTLAHIKDATWRHLGLTVG
jgi:hypothetical protein